MSEFSVNLPLGTGEGFTVKRKQFSVERNLAVPKQADWLGIRVAFTSSSYGAKPQNWIARTNSAGQR